MAGAGFLLAGAGFVIFVLHTMETAFTGHIWSLIGQGMLIGGGLWGLAQLWGTSSRGRR